MVFAIPGHPKDPKAQGPNQLIQSGATLVQTPEDILNHTPVKPLISDQAKGAGRFS